MVVITLLLPVAAVQEVPIFYNLFVSTPSDVSRVRALALEQLSHLRPENKVFVNSIGTPLPLPNTTLLAHHAEASEQVSLRALWNHCREHPNGNVVYMHSKGSFHPNRANDLLRHYMTRGALSKECASLPDFCNTCGSRMSPVPHPHFPGNMWLARCSYVAKLIDPAALADTLARFPTQSDDPNDACRGRGRMALEHWVLSHPDAAPCDLDGDPSYVYGYHDVPSPDGWVPSLAQSPRFELHEYSRHLDELRMCVDRTPVSGTSLSERLVEYQGLYGTMPSAQWWGWHILNVAEGVDAAQEADTARLQRNIFAMLSGLLAVGLLAMALSHRAERRGAYSRRRRLEEDHDIELPPAPH